MMRIPLSLRSKLTAAFLLVLVPVLGLIVYSHIREYHQMRDSLLQDQLRTEEAVGAAVEAVLDQGIAIGQTLSLDPMILGFNSTDPNTLQPYLARYLALFPEYRSVNVWDANGQFVASAIPLGPDDQASNISDRHHFQAAMATGLPAVSNVLVTRVGEDPAIVTASPIKDDAGRPIGLVTVIVNLDQVSKRVQDLPLLQGQAVFVADTEGRLAFHTANPSLSWEDRDTSSYRPVREVLSQGRFVGTAEGIPTSGPQLVAGSRTQSYGWVAAVSVPEDVVLGRVQQAAVGSLGIYMGIVLLATTIALALTFTITSPLGHLCSTMAALARGDLGCRAEVFTGDELEATSDSFNRMASSLQREQERLRELVEMGTALTSAENIHQLLELLAQRSTTLLGELTYVCLLTAHGSVRADYAIHAPDERTRERFRELLTCHHESIFTGVYRSVAESGESILVPRVGEWSLGGDLPRDLARAGAWSLMVVPLRGRGGVVGILTNLSLRQERTLGKNELSVAEDLANGAALVIDNALLLQQVQSQHRRLQTILDTTPVGVVVAEGASGRVTVSNSEADEILGKGSEIGSTIGQRAGSVGFHRMDGSLYRAEELPLARSLYDGEVVKGEEMKVRRPSGEEAWLLVYSAPLTLGNDNRPSAVAALLDITPLKAAQQQAEDAAQKAERRRKELDAVIGGAMEGIIIADIQGRMVRVNRRARDILGMQDPPLEGSLLEELGDIFEFHYPDGRRMPLEEWPIARVLRGESFVGLEALYHRQDGKDFHLLFSSGAVRDEKGKLQLGVVIFGDITTIREVERTREEFISVVAHDLRTPLTVINGFASVLHRLKPEQHGQANERKAVESILSSTKRLEKMVADLLDASRIEASRLVLAKESVDLPRLVEDVAERTVEITKDHPLEVEIRDALPSIEADPSRLEQVLTNLLSNAAKYSFPGTPISVLVQRVGSEAIVSVTNQGQGISPKEQETLFSRFRRTETAVATKVPGLGLGLYITKGLVEAHGGRIWVESEVGKYATFRFTLPLDHASEG